MEFYYYELFSQAYCSWFFTSINYWGLFLAFPPTPTPTPLSSGEIRGKWSIQHEEKKWYLLQ